MKPPPRKRPEAVIEKAGAKIAVWDERGLTVRAGKRSYHTRFEDYPISPKLLDPDVIRGNAPKFAGGEYKRTAAGISGHLRIGDKLFMLPRWENRKGEPWLEALVELDFAQDLPKPKLVGRFQGLSAAQGLIDEELHAMQEHLLVVTETGADWGIARFHTAEPGFAYTGAGSSLVHHEWRSDRILYAETTAFGMTVAGVFDLASETRRDAIETRGLLSFLPLQHDAAVIRFKSTTYVRSMESGAESRLNPDAGFLPTELGLLVYSPSVKPNRATVYDPLTWKPVLKWSHETQPSPQSASRTSGKPPGRVRKGR